MTKYTSFRELPRFISCSGYAVDMAIDYLKRWVENMENEMGLKMNPDFQRGHVWTEEQQVAYVEFLLKGGLTGRDVYFNCPGWPAGAHGSEYDEFVCVDGLQRITAILRFVNNEIKVFGSYYKEYVDKPDFVRHCLRIHVNDLERREEVLQWYLEMNSGGTPHSKEELERVQKMLDECKRNKTEKGV